MKSREQFCITEYKCPFCGQVMFVPRKNNKKREKNHIKTMYCPGCRSVRDFIQGNER